RLVEKFLDRQEDGDAESAQNADHAHRAEKVQRPREIFQQEPDSDQVEEYPEGPRDSVMRNSALPVYVADRYFADAGAVPRGQCRNKAVQFSVERHLLKDVAPVSLEGRAKVVNVDAAELRHQPVRTTRRNTAHPEIVDALLAPSADDVVTLGNFLEEHRDVGGIVLQVAVHGDDVLAARVIEAGGQR